MPILIGISLLACVALLLDFLESATFAYSKINNVDGYFKENNAIDYYLYLIVYCNHLMVHLFGWHSAIAALAFGTLTFYFVPKAVSIFQSIPDILEQRKAQIKYISEDISKFQSDLDKILDKMNADALKGSAKTPSQTSSATTIEEDLSKSRESDHLDT